MTRDKAKKYLIYTSLSYLMFLGIFRESLVLMLLAAIFVVIGWGLWLFTRNYKTAFSAMLIPWVVGILIIFHIIGMQDFSKMLPFLK